MLGSPRTDSGFYLARTKLSAKCYSGRETVGNIISNYLVVVHGLLQPNVGNIAGNVVHAASLAPPLVLLSEGVVLPT